MPRDMNVPISDMKLVREQCYINGKWCDADSGDTLDVTNKATGEVLGSVPKMGSDETRRAAAVAKMTVGDGLKGETQQGPLIEMAAVEKVEEHIQSAIDGGAKIALGGKRHALGGTFFEPTVLTGVTQKMKIAREETFGPVAPLFPFKTEEEAIGYANDTEFGLASYFYSRDIGRIWRVMEALEYGIVGINEGIISTEAAPFGGIKESGIGREGSKYGIDDFVEIKYALLGGIDS